MHNFIVAYKYTECHLLNYFLAKIFLPFEGKLFITSLLPFLNIYFPLYTLLHVYMHEYWKKVEM